MRAAVAKGGRIQVGIQHGLQVGLLLRMVCIDKTSDPLARRLS
jgi:hypothetical protein